MSNWTTREVAQSGNSWHWECEVPSAAVHKQNDVRCRTPIVTAIIIIIIIKKVFIYWNVLNDFLPSPLFYYLYVSYCVTSVVDKWTWLFCGLFVLDLESTALFFWPQAISQNVQNPARWTIGMSDTQPTGPLNSWCFCVHWLLIKVMFLLLLHTFLLFSYTTYTDGRTVTPLKMCLWCTCTQTLWKLK